MLNYFKNVKPEDWPAVVLRGAALVLIVFHLIAFTFIYQHLIFIASAVVMGLLLAREMYEDLAQKFFRLKAEKYESELMGAMEQENAPRERTLLIEGTSSLKDITERHNRH